MFVYAVLGKIMKIIFCTIIVFCSGYIGICIKNEYSKKVCFFTEFVAFLEYLSAKTAFFKDTLAENINNFIINNSPKNLSFYKALAESLCNATFNYNVLVSAIKVNIPSTEKQQLYSVITSLTTTDIIGLDKLLLGHITNVNLMLKKYQTLKKQKGDVISKLAVCFGLLICILIY